jgi:hypothetical protein
MKKYWGENILTLKKKRFRFRIISEPLGTIMAFLPQIVNRKEATILDTIFLVDLGAVIKNLLTFLKG